MDHRFRFAEPAMADPDQPPGTTESPRNWQRMKRQLQVNSTLEIHTEHSALLLLVSL